MYPIPKTKALMLSLCLLFVSFLRLVANVQTRYFTKNPAILGEFPSLCVDFTLESAFVHMLCYLFK
jgi:hypothetical protein